MSPPEAVRASAYGTRNHTAARSIRATMLPPAISIDRAFASRSESDEAQDDQLLAILTSPPGPDETATAEYDRKERQLAAYFAKTSRADANALHRRFAQPLLDDVLATCFASLPPWRRVRLLALLTRRIDPSALRSG